MFTDVHHVAFLVGDLDQAVERFERQYGAEQLTRREMTGDFELDVALYPIGSVLFELITPTTESGWVYETWRENGDGFFHIAFEVEDIEESMAAFREQGLSFESERAQEGFDWQVATFDPADTFVPMQIVEDEKTMAGRKANF